MNFDFGTEGHLRHLAAVVEGKGHIQIGKGYYPEIYARMHPIFLHYLRAVHKHFGGSLFFAEGHPVVRLRGKAAVCLFIAIKPYCYIQQKRVEKILRNWFRAQKKIREKRIKHVREHFHVYWPSKIQLWIFNALRTAGEKGLHSEYKIGVYSVDIAMPSLRLAIELDGWYWHQDKKKDCERDRILRSRGWHVKRFPAEAQSLPLVLKALREARLRGKACKL